MLKLVGRLSCVMFASELCFILLSKQSITEWYRHAPIFIGAAYIVYIAIQARMSLSYAQMVSVSICSSVMFVAMHQAAGHLFFSGIVKDIDFLSLDNAWLSLCLAATVVVGLFLCFAFVKITSRLICLR